MTRERSSDRSPREPAARPPRRWALIGPPQQIRQQGSRSGPPPWAGLRRSTSPGAGRSSDRRRRSGSRAAQPWTMDPGTDHRSRSGPPPWAELRRSPSPGAGLSSDRRSRSGSRAAVDQGPGTGSRSRSGPPPWAGLRRSPSSGAGHSSDPRQHGPGTDRRSRSACPLAPSISEIKKAGLFFCIFRRSFFPAL